MKTLKGYNKVQTRNTLFGLEYFDLLILLVVYLAIFLVSENLLVNIPLLALVYFFLKLYKKGKPPHWTTSVIRFLLRRRVYPLRRETNWEVFGK